MKKTEIKTSSRSTAVALGSPTQGRGVDIAALYIDMLCERFKDRGVKMSVKQGADVKREAESAMSRLIGLYPERAGVSAHDSKYNTQNIKGRACMSSDDFANYYRDLRDYKMPRFYSRAESEYEEADAAARAENVQESGRPPKKADRLTLKTRIGAKAKEAISHLNKNELGDLAEDWFEIKKDEEIREGDKKRFPKKTVSAILVVTLSLLLYVCSSVMVSRASAEVSSLEDRIEGLEYEIRDLEGKLNKKNDMLEIKNIAVNEYGMISADHVSSRYVDIKESEGFSETNEKSSGTSWLSEILRAMGFGE